jgi:hypothetical protein
MNAITLWIPPEDHSMYRSSQPYFTCQSCGQVINAGTLISCAYDDLFKLGMIGGHANTSSVHCTKCTFRDIFNGEIFSQCFKDLMMDNNFKRIIHDIVRDELKTIITEEVHDPNGTFSPHGPK